METHRSPRKKRGRRSAIEVANSQNILVLRKLVQEKVIPGERIAALIQEYLPVAQSKATESQGTESKDSE
jgi:hypothetical protein